MKKISIILATIAILISSCKKSEIYLTRSGDINVTIQGTVYNNEDNSPLSGVTVSVTYDGTTATAQTDTNGIYTIKNLNSGVYNVVFKLDGYGSKLYTVDANPIDYTGNHYIANFNANMIKFDQTLSTRIVIPVQSSDGTIVEYLPAANMPFTIYLDSTFQSNKISDTTDANGYISVANLPKDNIRLVINYKSGNYHYYAGSSPDYSIVQYPFDFSSRYALTQENLTYFYLITTNIIDASNGNSVSTFVNANNITFTFSSAVDLTYSDMYVKLYKTVSGSKVEVAKAITWSGAKCTVDPVGTALDTSAQYEIDLKVKSTSGIYYPTAGYATFDFKVQTPSYSLGKVASFSLFSPTSVAVDQTSVICKISTVTNAEKYVVYGQYGNADEYLLLGTYTPASTSDTELQASIDLTALDGITVPSSGLFSNSASYNLIVRAERADGTYGAFSSTLTLKY
jgi:hypothetical protein